MRLPPFPFVVLDTETTGLFPRVDKILECAIVRYEDGEKVAEYDSLFGITGDIPPHVQVLTRIRPADLTGKPSFAEEAPKIQQLLKGAVIFGHNIPYDLSMLAAEGIACEGVPWVDTAMIASLLFPELPSWSLVYLSSALKLPHDPPHRALGDVRATLALLASEWERLEELPGDLLGHFHELAERGPEGYATFFAAAKADGTARPGWLHMPKPLQKLHTACPVELIPISTPPAAEPDALLLTLISAPPSPHFLSCYVEQLPALPAGKTWVAVKNLAALLRLMKPEIVSASTVAHSHSSLRDPAASERFLAQEAFTAAEMTLALKLLAYAPRTLLDLPIHSEEYDVWKAKVACTRASPAYTSQYEAPRGTILLDHQQLLDLLKANAGPGADDRVIIDDASMLEDTATKGFRFLCSIDVLRAGAAGGDPLLTRFVDLYSLWLGKVKSAAAGVRYLVENDLRTPDARGLRERLQELLALPITEQLRMHLDHLAEMLTPENLEGRILWIEEFRDGDAVLQSVPLDIASLLWDVLYDRSRTTLLLPPGPRSSFQAIVPKQIDCVAFASAADPKAAPHIRYTDAELTLDRLLPRIDGKVIVLVSSKRTIEQLFITHTEHLETAGITLIAQGLAGGQGRMQAEFLAATGPAVWLLTPWMYEGVELPPGIVDHLWIASLPFDHPSHAVLGRRADRYANAFEDYLLPRLLHRLFRILRTYAYHRKEDGDVLILDDRVRTKSYGERVKGYLQGLTRED